MEDIMSTTNRPLSPHIGIYRWQNSMVLSILHRMTGMVLSGGMLLIVAWLAIAAYVPSIYADFYALATSPLGLFVLVGFSYCFYYHLCNGIRHLFWDIGKGFSLPVMVRSGWAVVYFSFLLTAFSWAFVYTSTKAQ